MVFQKYICCMADLLKGEMMNIKLGNINVVNPRNIWSNEEYDFTPWLAENIDTLSDVIGLPIIVEETEKRVGKYKLDLYGSVEGTNDKVVIENQIEISDHKHLGQLLTYASGLRASIIIWVTPIINDEHKQAIEWLNEISNDETSFFLIRPEVLQIDDSLPAVKFHLEASPNDFERTIKAIVNQNERKSHQIRRAFWSELIEYCKDNNFQWGANRRTTKDNWLSFAVGKSGFASVASFAMNSKFRAELVFETNEKEENKRIFDEIYKYRSEISDKYKLDFKWERLDEKKSSRIALYLDYCKDKLEQDDVYRNKCIEWLTNHVDLFRVIFKEYLIDKSII